ncbi:MAG: thioredoxin family protein [Myxococcota bacterium]
MRRAWPLMLLLGCTRPPEEPEQPADASAAEASALVWNDIASIDELSTLAADAHKANKGLMLDVRAAWCKPCRELEDKTFTDPAVARVLAQDWVLARLDVTETTPAAESLQRRLGASALPWVVLWSLRPDDAESFSHGQLPEAGYVVKTFVTAEELQPHLVH